MKMDYKKTFILGFGFFAISLCGALYDSYVPIFLSRFISSEMVIGFLMTMDNYAGLFLQPFFGSLSDRTKTRAGKRMPFLLIGMPLSALLVSLIPLHNGLVTLLITIVLYNLVMASYRSPTVALMPDITPKPLRSKANGVINLMGGVGSVIAFFVGSMLYKINKAYPFFMAAALLLICIVILYLKIKEKRDSLNYENPEEEGKHAIKEKFSFKGMRNVLFLLFAIFFWFVAQNSVATFFTLYGKEYLHVNEALASSKLTYFSLSMVVFALPAGLIGTKIGKKKTIVIGLVTMILVFGGLLFSGSIDAIGYMFIISGVGWALININSYPFVVSMTTGPMIGRYTGYYYVFSSLAAIVSPPLVGGLIQVFGYGILFQYSVIGFIVSLLCILMVKPPKDEVIAKEKHEKNSD